MFCYECGKEILEGSKFCSYCGTNLLSDDGNAVSVDTTGNSFESAEETFCMIIQDVFSITGRGTVVTGTVESGALYVGQNVKIGDYDDNVYSIEGIEKDGAVIDSAKKGDAVGILLSKLERTDKIKGKKLISLNSESLVNDIPLTIKYCSNCNIEYENDSVFCDKCGTKLQTKYHHADASNSTNQAPKKDNALTKDSDNKPNIYPSVSLNMISKYKGDVNVGVAESSGKFSVFNDRIEYRPQLGNAALGALGPLGMLASYANAKKKDIETYYYTNISNVSKSKYGGLMPAILLTLKDGSCFKFAGVAVNGFDDAIRIISKNIN